MAAQKTTSTSTIRKRVKKKRPGVHSKKKTARSKSSKNYVKLYCGQGKK